MYESGKVAVRAENLERSIDFYTRVLGFQVIVRGPGASVELEAAGLRLFLFERLPHVPDLPPGPRGMSISLWVTEIEATMAELQAQGAVFFGDVVDLPMMRIAMLEDPDEHQVLLIQAR